MDETPLFMYVDQEGKDIRDAIINSNIKSLSNFVSPTLNRKSIASIWAIGNDLEDYQKIKKFWNFQSDENMQESLKQFIKEYNQDASNQKAISKENVKLQKKFLESMKKYDAGEFVVAESELSAKFKPPVQLNVSSRIPIYKEGSTVKVWKEYRNPEVIELFSYANAEPNQIVFMDMDGNQGILDNNLGYIEFSSEPSKIDMIKSEIEKSISTPLQNIRKSKIKGEFSIKNKYFDRRIFAFMILKKNFYKNRVFLDESGRVLSKKDRFTLKYYPNTIQYSNPIFITLTNFGDDIVVKMAKIPGESDVRKTKVFVLGMLYDYDTLASGIVDDYKKIDKSLEFTYEILRKTQMKKPTTQATKTKQKLGPLQERNPELFGFKGYARLCAAANQPKIPDMDTVKKLLRDDPAKILEYPEGSGDYYMCDSKARKFPGLKPDTESAKIGRETKYQYVPCCYPIDQYKKRSSGLNKYRQVGTPSKVVPKKTAGILDKQKKLGEDRKGFIPTTLSDIMSFHGLKSDDFLRYGLPPSKQSIIDAIAMIKYPDEWKEDFETARDMVLIDLGKSDDLNAGLQSYTLSYMKEALEDDTIELKAKNFLPIMEYYLDAVVILIENDEMPKPDTRFGFIPNIFRRNKLVILYKHKDSEQIEVVGTYQKNYSTYASSTIIKRFLETKKKVFGFYSDMDYQFPRYANLIANAQKQYIDSYGKCRGFVINGQSVYMAPVAPTNLPVEERTLIKTPLKLLKSLKLTPLYEDDACLYTKSFVFPKKKSYGYENPPDDFVKPYIVVEDKFFMPSYKAENDAITLMNGYDVEIDDETEKLLNKWEELDVEPPRQAIILNENTDIITLNNPSEVMKYVNLLKILGKFQWEKLEDIKHNPGTIHNILLEDTTTLKVMDVKKKPKNPPTDKGLYDVSYGRKIEDGPGLVRYHNDKYGVII